jgi:hypothetical protein
VARWLSDKFVGPPHMPRDSDGGGEAMSEEGMRSSSQIGVWVLDPYDAEAHSRAGYPFHGEGWPNNSAPLQPSVERLKDIRLLPCYESCRSRAEVRADRRSQASKSHMFRSCRLCRALAIGILAIGAVRAVMAVKRQTARVVAEPALIKGGIVIGGLK